FLNTLSVMSVLSEIAEFKTRNAAVVADGDHVRRLKTQRGEWSGKFTRRESLTHQDIGQPCSQWRHLPPAPGTRLLRAAKPALEAQHSASLPALAGQFAHEQLARHLQSRAD